MAANSTDSQLQELKAENRVLRSDNKKLRLQLKNQKLSTQKESTNHGGYFKKLAAFFCICFAVALLLVGNVLFWVGSTVVETDRYVEATSPIIKNSAVQDALATNITQKLFANTDVTSITEQVLPPRADFLAPTIAEQLKNHTDDTIKKVLQRPQFQTRWNEAQARAHERFIRLVESSGSDGAIDISEVYKDASGQLKNTKLAFLANKPLPDKIGKVQLVEGNWLSALQKTIQNIDTWRFLAILLLVILSAVGVWLSRNRRKTVIILGGLFAFAMFITLVSFRLAREVMASNIDPQYAEAARQTYTIVFHSLVIQTTTILFASLLIMLIAWLSGDSKGSLKVKQKINQLFSGKLHQAIFSHGENSFTLWLGAHKNSLQWLSVAVVGLTTLFVRLTPGTLFAQVIVIILLVLSIEVLAAEKSKVES